MYPLLSVSTYPPFSFATISSSDPRPASTPGSLGGQRTLSLLQSPPDIRIRFPFAFGSSSSCCRFRSVPSTHMPLSRAYRCQCPHSYRFCNFCSSETPSFFFLCVHVRARILLWLLVIAHTANNSRSGERAETRNRGPSLARSPPCGTAYDADCAEDATLDASAPQPPRCPCTAAPCGGIPVDAAKLDASASSPQTRHSLARTTAALARSESLAQSASGRMARSGRGEGRHEALLVRHGSQVASAAATATAGHR